MFILSLLLILCSGAHGYEKATRPSLFDAAEAAPKEPRIPFSFDKKSLMAILDELAAQKKINIVPPQGADLELLKQQVVTFHPRQGDELPLNKAWTLLQTILDMTGYAISKKSDTLYKITRVTRPDEPGINREVLPLYVNVLYTELPRSDERIRVIYELRNLRVPTPEDRENPVGRILKEVLSTNATISFEPKANLFFVTDKAAVIANAVQILSELDRSGFHEMVDVIQLRFVSASQVIKIFDQLKKASGQPEGLSPYIRGEQTESLAYFAGDTRIIADERQNMLILMGRQAAIERISDFIQNSLDVAPESGKSILHYYDLQYLDAKPFAEVLQRVVSSPQVMGAQATAAPLTGPERYFQGVVVMAEEVKVIDIKTTTEEVSLTQIKGAEAPAEVGIGAQQTITGGNRLIVAAIHDDWLRIKDIIQSLDKPQPQVILEVLVIDIIGSRTKTIAGTTHGPVDCNSPEGLQFLANNITNANAVLGVMPSALNEDLLSSMGYPPASAVDANNPPLPSLIAPGSVIFSINDPGTPGIAALLNILDTIANTKILSHPFLVTTNNQKATVLSQEVRRVRGDAFSGPGGVVTINVIDLPATLQVQMIPRLSSLERLSLQVAVDINTYTSTSSLTRLTRRVNSNVNLASGQILAIGGLSRKDQADAKTGTWILQDIPIIGFLFGSKSAAVSDTNIMIFICPTIVQPKLRGGLDLYTADKIRKTRRDIAAEAVFGELRDPIVKVFFNTNKASDSLLNSYLSDVINPPDAELIKTTKEKRREARRPKRRKDQPAKQLPTKPGPVGPLAA